MDSNENEGFPNWQFSFSAFTLLPTRAQFRVKCPCQQILIDSSSLDQLLEFEKVFLRNSAFQHTLIRYALIKNYGIIWEFFPT